MKAGSVVCVIVALVVGGVVGVVVYNHMFLSKSGNPQGTATTITLSYGGGTCTQNGSSTTPVTVTAGSTVTWQSDTGVPVQVVFPANSSPAYQTGSGAAASLGGTYPQPNATSSTYNYQSITIGGQSCNNVGPGQLGMIVKW